MQQQQQQHMSVRSVRWLVYKVGIGTLFAFILAIVALAVNDKNGAIAPVQSLFSAAASAAGLNLFQSENVSIAVETSDDLLAAFQTMADKLQTQQQRIEVLQQQLAQKMDSTSTLTTTTTTATSTLSATTTSVTTTTTLVPRNCKEVRV